MKLTIVMAAMAIGSIYSCNGQINKKKMTEQNNNPLLCDIETGVCAPGTAQAVSDKTSVQAKIKPVKVIYYTDPICSSCWGIEPQLRKLKMEYGNALEIEYRMGGLLPDWSYNSGGISKPADVAHHWDEVSLHYDMPIDGDVWLEDPMNSSYPPSIAFKAAQMQDEHKAVIFLREMRHLLFLQKKNITKWEHLATAATKAGLDVARLKADYEGKAKELFEEDLALGRSLGVRGFPTMIFSNAAGDKEVVYGSKPYNAYQAAIAKLHPGVAKETYDTGWKQLFAAYPTLTTREFAELSGISRADAQTQLEELYAAKHLDKLDTKNGAMWLIK